MMSPLRRKAADLAGVLGYGLNIGENRTPAACPPLGPGVVRHELMGVQLVGYGQQRDNRRAEHQECPPLLEPCLG